MKRVLLLLLLMHTSTGQRGISVMKALSTSIGDEVLVCQERMRFDNNIIDDFLDFWNDKNELRSRELGCVLNCVFEHMELLTDDGRQIKEENVKAFSQSIGADDVMSRKLVDLFQLCKRATSRVSESCANALEVTKCFRYGIFQLRWAPQKNEHPSRRTAEGLAERPVERQENIRVERIVEQQVQRPAKRPANRANVNTGAELSERGIGSFIRRLIDIVRGPVRYLNKHSG